MSTAEDPSIPQLIAEGAALFNTRHFWEAHEAWEEAWLELQAEDEPAKAEFVQGLILLTAGFENLKRGKPAGFRVQLAKGLRRLRAQRGTGPSLGLQDEDVFREAVLDAYLHALEHKVPHLDDLDREVPHLHIA
ncbi:MAG: DUF309 domain-containing protein [Candidatus Thermoplasmatota archaeon]|nr:DUF309 domain-containing protein [Candidatus Thermoplasmatota archaeon]